MLASRVGQELAAVVVALRDDDPKRGTVVIDDPAVETAIAADRPPELGGRVRLRPAGTDVEARTVTFELL